MDLNTFNAIRQAWELERAEAQSTAARLALQIRDLDKTWKKLQEKAAIAENAGENGEKGATLTAKVMEAITGLPDVFESPDVWGAVSAADPSIRDDETFRSNIAHTLKRLVADSKIKLEEKGQGKRPSRYSKCTVAQSEGGPIAISA